MRNPNARVPLEFEPTCSGDRYHVDYQPIIEDGCIQLVEAGRTDIQAVIDSYSDSWASSLRLRIPARVEGKPLKSPNMGVLALSTEVSPKERR